MIIIFFAATLLLWARIINAGLEEKGLVIVQRTQKLQDIGKPLISSTEKAKPYLFPTSEKDKKTDIQKVKIADLEMVDVTAIQTARKQWLNTKPLIKM